MISGAKASQINHIAREQAECDLQFAGFLVFHCPLKEDAVETLKMLSQSSHRVRRLYYMLRREKLSNSVLIVHNDYR